MKLWNFTRVHSETMWALFVFNHTEFPQHTARKQAGKAAGQARLDQKTLGKQELDNALLFP